MPRMASAAEPTAAVAVTERLAQPHIASVGPDGLLEFSEVHPPPLTPAPTPSSRP